MVLAIVMAWVGRGAGTAVAGPLQQTYSFGVPLLVMNVAVQPDGSASIVYDITFENFGNPIDIIDVGTPNKDYDIGQMEASINGVPLTDIRPSEYIDVGVEVHLVGDAIMAGETGTLHLEFSVPDLVFADTTNKENASFQITPTWFDAGAVRGTGDVEIRVASLPGVDPEAVLYQDVPFTDKVQDEVGRVVAVWRFEDVTMTEARRVGVSFPREGFTQIKEITFWDILGRWLAGVLPVVGGVLMFCLPFAVPIFIVFVVIRAIVKAMKPDYLPPIAQVEGGGIKRGLTAPEAAALLELPLTKVLGLIVFGMLEKGLVRQTRVGPFTVEVVEAYRAADRADLTDAEARARYRREIARQKGTVIHPYEDPFLDLFEAHPDIPVEKLPVVKPMETLVNGMAAKMAGFDLSDTQDYYRRVIERAMQQAESIGDIQQREAYLDQYLPWIMMRPNYRPALSVGGYNYWPVWARPGAVTTTAAGGGLLAGASRPSGSGSTTKFGDVSASFAGWAETTMGGMAAAILPTALSKPVVMSGGGGSSGGGSSHSSCACACAGCACACACAGGGR
jgi:hypothetical protein